MPGLDSLRRQRMFERLVLQPSLAHAQQAASVHQKLPVGRHQVGHWLAPQCEAMQPQPAVERMRHTVPTALELTPLDLQLQEILPSTTAVPTGAAFPTNM